MSQSGNDGSHHTSSNSANEGYICSSPFANEPSQADVTVELDFKDGKRDNLSVTETNFQDEVLCKKELKSDACRAEESENSEKKIVNIEGGDLEEGEIQDTPSSKFFDAYSCRYYQKGFCVYGKDCRFFHLSDKGLYSMFDYPTAVTKSIPRPSQLPPEQKCILVTPEFESVETDFDRDLKEAVERTKESKNKVVVRREKLRMTIQSDGCIAKKTILPKSPVKDGCNQSHVSKARDFSRTKKEHSYDIAAKAKSTGGDLPNKTIYRLDSRNPLKRSNTPSHVQWSPKSVSYSSLSRSRSRSSCDQSSCSRSCTPSPKRDRRVLSSRVSSSYWKRHASSSSESSSSCSSFSKVSRRANRRNPRSKSPDETMKMSNRRTSFKILLPRGLERERSRLPRREVSRSFVPSKIQVTGNLVSLPPKSRNRSCSDMSISPLSDPSWNGKNGHPGERPVVCYSPERHASDMSISPLSDASSPDRFSSKTERTDPSVSKTNVKKINVDVDQKGLSNGLDLYKAGSRKNTTWGKSLCTSRSIANPSSGTQIKKSDPLLADLLKFHSNVQTSDFFKEKKNVPSMTPSKTEASKLVNGPIERNVIQKVKQKTDVNQSKLTKREILLKRLQEINAAIQKKKMFALRNVSENV